MDLSWKSINSIDRLLNTFKRQMFTKKTRFLWISSIANANKCQDLSNRMMTFFLISNLTQKRRIKYLGPIRRIKPVTPDMAQGWTDTPKGSFHQYIEKIEGKT